MHGNAASSLAPPPPLPKRRNAVLRLYDAPLYRDGAFWNTVAWGLIAGFSIPASPPAEPSKLPLWLDTLLAIIAMVILCGVVPAWIRLLVRRWRWRKRPQPPRQEAPPAPPLHAVPVGPALRATTTPPPSPSATHRVDHSTLPSEVPTDARNTFPHPIARALRALHQAPTDKDRYEALLDAAEILAITISVTAAALLQGRLENRSGGQEHLPEAGQHNLSVLRRAYFGKGAMFGTWTTWLKGLQPLAAAQPDLVAGLHHALGDGPDDPGIVTHLNALREERNRSAHGNKPKSQPESALRVAEGMRHLERALAKAQFLKATPWLFTVSCVYHPRSRNFEVVAKDATGDHPDFERRTFTWEHPVGIDMFYVHGPEGPVPLSPFVADLFCPQCRQMEVSYAYKAGKGNRTATFKSFGRGHDIAAPHMVDDLLSLPDQRG
ncbi:hypothetical protein [Streptomyces sp. Rer75]|uniref:hypothetical protein n=1 Tax=Streptomyces sp. Rer75 TaxID=2750011 RepID=UPI0015D0CFC0|nr:hypothetical protein [Streptomyces sp. Rer75]QLH23065.1 hypothetical protein HYQ63_22555 [Streptomyces sp. Rer75]